MTTKWEQFKQSYCWLENLGMGLDLSHVQLPNDFFEPTPTINAALAAMEALDAGAVSNADEDRMVGHYWLRAPERAPNQELKKLIEDTKRDIKEFTAKVHAAEICSEKNKAFKHVLVIGIGGSALGPQLFAACFDSQSQPMQAYFLDNTDPDGHLHILSSIPDLEATLVLVVSKSGGTRETKNGMEIAEAYWRDHGLDPGKAFVAITQEGSALDQHADSNQWLKKFPMWDWVGGRTSVWSAVGLVPAALIGVDVEALLSGAAMMDEWNRKKDIRENPAALLAKVMFLLGDGHGTKNMVVLPYKDRLSLFSKYLQQLVMESLGKKFDRDGNVVHQGLTVLGNKGSTDQHSYVQQLRDGLSDFFAVFVDVLKDLTPFTQGDCSEQTRISGDYLSGFFQGTQQALFESERSSIVITLQELSVTSLGALLALFERFVGIYAELINVNAYHQPGVEAGKKAAEQVVELQKKALQFLESDSEPQTIEALAEQLGAVGQELALFRILRRLVANGRLSASDSNLFQASFSIR